MNKSSQSSVHQQHYMVIWAQSSKVNLPKHSKLSSVTRRGEHAHIVHRNAVLERVHKTVHNMLAMRHGASTQYSGCYYAPNGGVRRFTNHIRKSCCTMCDGHLYACARGCRQHGVNDIETGQVAYVRVRKCFLCLLAFVVVNFYCFQDGRHHVYQAGRAPAKEIFDHHINVVNTLNPAAYDYLYNTRHDTWATYVTRGNFVLDVALMVLQ